MPNLDMNGARTRVRGLRGLWLGPLDYLNWTMERSRMVALAPIIHVGAHSFKFAWSWLFSPPKRVKPYTQHLKTKLRKTLNSCSLSFFDTFLCVDGVPSYVLDQYDPIDVGEDKEREQKVKRGSAFAATSSESVGVCCFSSDGSMFAICYISGKVTVWDTNTGKIFAETMMVDAPALSVSFLGESNFTLMICTHEYKCWKWEIGNKDTSPFEICDKKSISIVDGKIFSQKSEFYANGTKLVISTIVSCDEGLILDVALIRMLVDDDEHKSCHLRPVLVAANYVICRTIVSTDGKGILVGLMDQRLEDSYCLLWPNYEWDRTIYKRLDKGTIGSWSSNSRYVVTWIMTNRLNPDVDDESSAFIWNVEQMRENLANHEYSFEPKKITNPFGDKVFWCQMTQDMDEKNWLIMGISGEFARFMLWDTETDTHTHTLETGISAKDMILFNKEAWIESCVKQKSVKGLNPVDMAIDGSMFGAVLGIPGELFVWDVALGIELVRISSKGLEANHFKGGLDLVMSPSCTKFAAIGSNRVMVFCPSIPHQNKGRSMNCLQAQMVQLDNPQTSQDWSSSFKMSFSGDGDSLAILCIGLPKIQIWNLPEGTSCKIECSHIEEGENIQDFCLSRNGKYIAIYTKKSVQVWNCDTEKISTIIDMEGVKCEIATMGINDNASELVACMQDGSICCYELSRDDMHSFSCDDLAPLFSPRFGYGNLSLIEGVKAWFKTPSANINQPLLSKRERAGPSLATGTSIDIPSGTHFPTATRHVLAGELDEASFQVSPTFKEVIRISKQQGVEAWDMETRTKLEPTVNDITLIKKSSHLYSGISSLTAQAHDDLTSKKNLLLHGTSIDLSRRTTLVQSSREDVIVAGNSSSHSFSQQRDLMTFDIEVTEEKQEGSHSVYVINLNGAEYRRRLGGKNLEPGKGLAISHDGRHVACLAGNDGSKVVVWNVYASERLLPDYDFLSLTLGDDISHKEGIKREIVPLMDEFETNFFMFIHPNGMSLLDEAIYRCNSHLLRTILQYVLKKKMKVSFLTRMTQNRLLPTLQSHNAIEASIEERSPNTLSVILKYLLARVTHEDEVTTIISSSLGDILQVYPAIFVRTVQNHTLWGPGHEMEVSERALDGSNFTSITSDSLEISDKEAQDLWMRQLDEHNQAIRNPLIANVTFALPYRHACEIGSRGFLRLLFINRAPSTVFGTFVVTSIVDYKWRKYARNILIEELAYHCVLCICFSVYCFALINESPNNKESEHNGEGDSTLTNSTLVLCWPIAFPGLYRELCQCLSYWREHGHPGYVYWLTSAWNWIEVFSYLNVLVIIPLGQFAFLTEGSDRETLSALVAIESLLIWSRMLFYARPFNHTGPLVLTIGAIVNKILYFLVLALSVMFGFALAFCVLYRHVESNDDIAMNDSGLDYVKANQVDDGNDHAESMDKAFGSFKRSFFTVFGYTFGDFDFEIQYHAPSPFTALTLFVLYVVSLAIILLNMLIALMSEKFARIHENKKIRLIEARARAIDDIDAMLSYRRRKQLGKNIGKYLHVMIPADKQDILTQGSSPLKLQSKANNRMPKTQNKQLLQELDRLLERRGVLRARKSSRHLATQNTLARSQPRLAAIQEPDIATTSSHQGPMLPIDDSEPEPHWNESDSEESDFLDAYEDESD